jgi:hypothetical protein
MAVVQELQICAKHQQFRGNSRTEPEVKLEGRERGFIIIGEGGNLDSLVAAMVGEIERQVQPA